MAEFINEEAGTVREQKPSTGAVSDNLGQETLMDEMSFKFPFTPSAPRVQPPNLCVGQRAATPFTSIPFTMLDWEFHDHFFSNNPPPNQTNRLALTMTNHITPQFQHLHSE